MPRIADIYICDICYGPVELAYTGTGSCKCESCTMDAWHAAKISTPLVAWHSMQPPKREHGTKVSPVPAPEALDAHFVPGSIARTARRTL